MLRRSKLYEAQQAERASFVEDRGWEVPQRFSSCAEEYDTLNHAAGVLDLTSHGVIKVAGPDRVRFLHGMLTNNIKALNPGQGCYAALLTPQGRTVADMQVYCLENCFLLTVEPDLREKVPAVLKKFVIGDQVELLDQLEELALLSIQGPKSLEFLNQNASRLNSSPQLFDHFQTEIQGIGVRICRINRTPKGGFDVIVTQRELLELWRLVQDLGRTLGIRPVGLEPHNIHRVEAGIPCYGIDMDETNIPLETGLNHAISLNKGCYIGQEIIARATYLGHVNRKLVGLLLNGDSSASKGDKVFKGEKELGWITSSVHSPSLQRPIALGYIRREAMEPGTEVVVDHAGTFVPGEVTRLPFVTCSI